MSNDKLIFVGTFVSSKSFSDLEIFKGFLCVENGKITQRGTIKEFQTLYSLGTFSGQALMELLENQFFMPGFVDCHTHAPQFPNIGLGLDRPLLEWLDKYTFPLESRYKDTVFATKVYDQVVRRLVNNGTTTACYFGSLHLEGTLQLAKSVLKYGQRALVGKVSMNVKNDAGYYNDTDKELREVKAFVDGVLALKNDLVEPIITPRFAISCDHTLMTGLADIAEENDLRIQSHISENLGEIEYVLQTNPDCSSYAAVYDKNRILTNKCIMAHAIHLKDEEMELMAKKGVSVAHCPASNTRLKSGLCPVKKLLHCGLTVGLGTDVSGGDSATMLDAMRRAMDVSTHLELLGQPASTLEWWEAFYLATLGGAKALNLDHKTGNFDIGKDFDALLIDVYNNGAPIDNYHTEDLSNKDYALHLVQRFVYLGDDRNIIQVYVKGNKVKRM